VITDVLLTGLLIFAGLAAYRFFPAFLKILRRFDETNIRRIAAEERDRNDPTAHFRHTLGIAAEQVEAVSELIVLDPRTATSVTRYLFEGQQFATREDAERTRAEKVRNLARGYYMELPAALAAPRDDKLN